jgi:mRNA-degrading endonuclease toxin of MazEF toxin-antitoxin module
MHGKRPVVIVSANRLNETSTLVTVVPMTTNTLKKIYPTQIEIIMNGTRSRIKCDQIRVVNKTDLEPPIAGLNLAALGALDNALMYTLGVEIDTAGCAKLAAVSEEV